MRLDRRRAAKKEALMGKAKTITRPNLDWANLTFGYTKTDCNIRYVWRNGQWDGGTLTADDAFGMAVPHPQQTEFHGHCVLPFMGLGSFV